MELAVYNTQGKATSKKVKLSDSIFGIEPNDHAIYLDVKLIMANKRQGTHMARERADVAGSTKKIKKQKGTGTARAGSIKNPLFRGGGTVFGPRPRIYSFKLNKKQRKLARMSALSYKAKEDAILILEDIQLDSPKTKEYTSVLNNLKVGDVKTLLVVPENNTNVYLSSRNVKNTKVLEASQVNTYDVLNCKKLIISEGAVDKIEKLFS
ncbi:50S ribosomal protein L4 [Flavobacteriales bacterium]|jgi:large subunit ribosomal protein L4|nr:50S ribosomal protein L4 [Crocinitomicaceae bacterium]MBT5401939.1 50S ribosomal protein L4 [Crocinitomicaceae bacterium]MBT6513959.1 50S ribosomal protein L4 [Crocinitomicaceae bacterium]MDC3336737.1 50S ribosomal protein L4 [Flavobacteriales bacterium]MDG2330789.1 50S ribosomal protein L4 [Flavobacteriales bacterium]